MIVYNPVVDFYGFDKTEDLKPLINIQGESRSEILTRRLDCSMVFDNKEDLLDFVNKLTKVASAFKYGEPVQDES